MSDFDPDKVRLSTGHFINGQFVSASGKTMGIKRPSDGQHYADINEAGAETVGEAVSLAEDARIRSGWSSCSPRERGAAISRWADLIDADKDYLAQLEAVGSTRPITDTILYRFNRDRGGDHEPGRVAGYQARDAGTGRKKPAAGF